MDHLRRLARGVKEAEELVLPNAMAGSKELAGLASLGNGAWSTTVNATRERTVAKYIESSSSAPSAESKAKKRKKKNTVADDGYAKVIKVGSPSSCRALRHKFAARSLSRSIAFDLALCDR